MERHNMELGKVGGWFKVSRKSFTTEREMYNNTFVRLIPI